MHAAYICHACPGFKGKNLPQGRLHLVHIIPKIFRLVLLDQKAFHKELKYATRCSAHLSLQNRCRYFHHDSFVNCLVVLSLEIVQNCDLFVGAEAFI